MSKNSAIFTDIEQEDIRKAIEHAEKSTSGEIRICIEKKCPVPDAFERASIYFLKIGMDKTALRNGVLIYIATDDHKFAIIGDEGINARVPADFWDTTKETMLAHFKSENLSLGVIAGITAAGEQLKKLFPARNGDKNELSDDISYI
ncbi:TPM domain-containing protein [Arcticibacter eurypsychrophilus]|uniref:TPM domain-containing protein n=1 Tax=Arcticibacter eurypsychrophilus TaxID=1434752 RepID=UPI00084D0726|nr:TPM domain-containing protein [Arcticibacter eurypsychrophilus]